MTIKNVFALVALIVTLTGCAPKPYWTLTDDANQLAKSNSFEFSVPQGWNRTTAADTWDQVTIDDRERTIHLERMTASRDGLGLHSISVTRRYPDTAFPAIKKKSNANMLPLEVADLYVSDLRKRTGLERLTVLSNKPATVDGKPAFQLVMEFKNNDGLRIRIVSHGFVDKTGFYTINYRSPTLYYYERDYAAYAGIVRSFRQLKGAFNPLPGVPGWAKQFT